ncbi:MAG: hypothetical protein ACXWI3_12625 [Croceibacterium sp.]
MKRFAPIGAAVLVLMAGLAGLGPALAQSSAVQDPATQNPAVTPPPSLDDSRYSFHRMGDGFVRLDSRTGQLAQCGWAATGWSCKMVPDERAALESEIGRLQRDNAELKKSLLSRGLELPGGIVAEAPAAAPVPPANVPDASAREPKMPSDAELDRAFSFMKNVWRRLVDMMVDLQRDIQKKS